MTKLQASELLQKMIELDRIQSVINKSIDKRIDANTIELFINPESRAKIFEIIIRDEYVIDPPYIAKIPKDDGGQREVYINAGIDRMVLALCNDVLCELFQDMISEHCVSYKKGVCTQMVVREVASKIENLEGFKTDFSKYFDTVYISAIENVFDTIEKRLGFEKDTEPVVNMLRRYYRQDTYYETKKDMKLERNVQHRYQGLKQGCSVASFLADAILYELDEFMANKYEVYYRYSDDCIILDKNISEMVSDINEIGSKYGVKLNPKKVKNIQEDGYWIKFLGFNINWSNGNVTLSKTRIDKFQNEIDYWVHQAISRKRNVEWAWLNIKRKLYEGDYCWATSCLGTINVDKDLIEMDKYLQDALISVSTRKTKIGGLGSNQIYKDFTITRGKGRNVRANKEKVHDIRNLISDYHTIKCLADDLKISKSVFEAKVRSMY